MANATRILAFAGSSRRESLNKKFLATVVDAARVAGAELTVVDLGELNLPLYNGDLEAAHGLPENAKKLIALIHDHAGLLIASPEYNSMITPLLKNTLDWCTRGGKNPFTGKVAGVISASPGPFGGIRSLQITRQLLTNLGCLVIPATALLPAADKAFDADGHLTQPRAQESARTVATALVETTRKLQAP